MMVIIAYHLHASGGDICPLVYQFDVDLITVNKNYNLDILSNSKNLTSPYLIVVADGHPDIDIIAILVNLLDKDTPAFFVKPNRSRYGAIPLLIGDYFRKAERSRRKSKQNRIFPGSGK